MSTVYSISLAGIKDGIDKLNLAGSNASGASADKRPIVNTTDQKYNGMGVIVDIKQFVDTGDKLQNYSVKKVPPTNAVPDGSTNISSNTGANATGNLLKADSEKPGVLASGPQGATGRKIGSLSFDTPANNGTGNSAGSLMGSLMSVKPNAAGMNTLNASTRKNGSLISNTSVNSLNGGILGSSNLNPGALNTNMLNSNPLDYNAKASIFSPLQPSNNAFNEEVYERMSSKNALSASSSPFKAPDEAERGVLDIKA